MAQLRQAANMWMVYSANRLRPVLKRRDQFVTNARLCWSEMMNFAAFFDD
jgi:hypothetical protein